MGSSLVENLSAKEIAELDSYFHAEGLDSWMDKLFRELMELPEKDISKARVIFSYLANHENTEVRRTAAILVGHIVKVDKAYTLPLWRLLLEDQSQEVRFAAFESLSEFSSDHVSLADAKPLFDAYRKAEESKNQV